MEAELRWTTERMDDGRSSFRPQYVGYMSKNAFLGVISGRIKRQFFLGLCKYEVD